jgi:hypothetical protein
VVLLCPARVLNMSAESSSNVGSLKLTARMNNIGKFEGILDEEDRNVVSYDIPISFLRVKLDGETSHISDGICTSAGSQDGRETHEDGRGSRCVGEYTCTGDIRGTLVKLECSKGSSSTCMDDSLGNPFMVESHDLREVY